MHAPFELWPHTIFVGLAGSHAHGTARDGSDVDVRGVCVAPLPVRLSLFTRFEQADGPLDDALAASVMPRLLAHPSAARGVGVKVEGTVYDVAKFLDLCAAANPNALEILFTDPQDWLLVSPAWRRLYAERHRFLTRKVQQTFLGYALAQLKKIRSHRAWLLNPPERKPTRRDFGLPEFGTLGRDDQSRIEQAIAAKLRQYAIDEIEMPRATRIELQQRLDAFWRDTFACDDDELEARMRAVATHALSLPADVVATLNAERAYRAAMKQWQAYEAWRQNRNPARAELERQHGYDTKHASHLIRLMRMGLEVLRTGDLQVRRPDADDLIAIRDGALTYDELLVMAAALQLEMEAASDESTLPPDVDREHVDRIAFELMRNREL